MYARPYPYIGPDQFGSRAQQCETTVIPGLYGTFLAIAVMLNIKKWIQFHMRIMAKARAAHDQDLYDRELARY